MIRPLSFPRRPFIAGLLLGLLACGSDAAGPVSPPPQPIQVERMDGLVGFEAALDSLRVELRIPAMGAAIVHDGEIAWSRGFGYADAEAEVPATATTSFHLASLTKTFAATIIMQLVEQGLVDLEDPVSEYGIELPSSGTIRVRHLLTHTSEGVPGSAYRYNGSRFGQLDRVIEGATGQTFGALLVERILEPLGFRNTAPNVQDLVAFALTGMDRDAFMANMAKPYELQGSGVFPAQYPGHFGTAAGLIASADDMAAYSIAIDEGRFLAPETWELVFTPAISNDGETLPYGLGWFIHMHQGLELQWHYGLWNANSSLIVRAPERGLAFVVLTNTSMLSAAYNLGIDSNVLRSDVARLFVDSFVTGNDPLPAQP